MGCCNNTEKSKRYKIYQVSYTKGLKGYSDIGEYTTHSIEEAVVEYINDEQDVVLRDNVDVVYAREVDTEKWTKFLMTVSIKVTNLTELKE